MKKYFRIKDNNTYIYYKAPEFIDNKYLRNYGGKVPNIQFLLNYYGADNIEIIKKQEEIATEKYPARVSVTEMRKGKVLKYDFITGKWEYTFNEDYKKYIDKFCIVDKHYFVFSLDLFNAGLMEDIKRVYNNIIDTILKPLNKLKYRDAKLVLDSYENLEVLAKFKKV